MNEGGLQTGVICEVVRDDHDGQPYKLKKVLGCDVTEYFFSESHVQKVTEAGQASSSPPGPRHSGRIGAVPNGISRTDGGAIIWSSDANAEHGYTWENFRQGWREPLETVFTGRTDCKWTCCGGRYDSPPCA